jgi:hypothetical protein
MEQKPPDLDASGKPVDLDANGQPVEVSATISSKPPDIESEPIQEGVLKAITTEEPKEGLLKRAWDVGTTPLVNFSPEFTKAQEQFTQEHPYIGSAGNFGLETLRSLTTPVNIATGAAGIGEGIAAKAGAPLVRKGLEVGRRLLSAPMIGEGAENVFHGDSLGQMAAGALEMAGGMHGTFGGKSAFGGPLRPISQAAEDVARGIELELPAQDAVNKLNTALKQSAPLRVEQGKLNRLERAERVNKAKEIQPTSVEEFNRQKGMLAGEYQKVGGPNIDLDEGEITSLFKAINAYGDDEFARIHARQGLQDLLEGRLPQPHEIRMLREIFGNEIEGNINALNKVDMRKRFIQEAVNLPRAIQSSIDISAPLRQGLPLISRKEWWTSWNGMIKSGLSENAYRGTMDSIMKNPSYNFSQMREVGLKLTDLLDFTRKEEMIMSNWAEKIPGVRASNRAYTAFLNKLRMDTFNSLISDAEKAGLNPKEDLRLAHDIAAYVNNATGRGDLGKLEKYATGLNNIFYSPRMIASRVNLLNQSLNPFTYAKMDPFVKKQYIRSLISTAAFWGTADSLALYAGAHVNLDPRSADFGKAQFGNVRVDPPAGFQQYLVAATRLLSGQYVSTTAGKENDVRELSGLSGGSLYGAATGSEESPVRKGKFRSTSTGKIAGRFTANKLAPLTRFAWDVFDPMSEHLPFDAKQRAAELFIPMFMKDVWDLAHEDPDLVPWLGALSSAGMGVQDYSSR